MKRYSLLLLFVLCAGVSAQVPLAIKVEIAQAEDARRYDHVLEGLMKWPGAELRSRAALAAGRIGDDKAIPALVALLENDRVPEVRVTAAFAIGEIESIKGADAILRAIGETARAQVPGVREPENSNRARLVEAAGKIAAANAQDPKAKDLAQAIMFTLQAELLQGAGHDKPTVLQALTAALRARPSGADATVQKFLAFTDPDIVATALNTLARLRAKNANRDARDLLATHVNAIVRANAARLLGAAEDKEAVDVLIKAATEDTDLRVRVSAIRSLAALRDSKAADKLLERGETLLADYKKSKLANSVEKNELLEIATGIGRLLSATRKAKALTLLEQIMVRDRFHSSESMVAWVRVAQRPFDGNISSGTNGKETIWRSVSTMSQGLREVASFDDKDFKAMKSDATSFLKESIDGLWSLTEASDRSDRSLMGSDLLRAFSAYKSADLNVTLIKALQSDDLFIRSTAADLLADQPTSKENVDALKTAFTKALLTDKAYNDAQFSILDALFKLDKKESVGALLAALNAPDYLLRQKAFQMLADKDLQKDFPGIATSLENARKNGKDQVLRYNAAFGTKLGQVLNTRADYVRALSRKNGSVKAILTTEKGTFTIDFYPEEAPLTVDNFIRLARSGFFNGLEVHRVVPNFVMQDGDPRGDGNGGPGWSIRCEVNMLPYERGMVGMALSGKDTGGSQWFVTHSPQPHLDGGYTIFGRVNEKDMKVVDNIVRGDKILTVKIVGR